MFTKHKIIYLYGKKLVETAHIIPPVKNQYKLGNEACYIHVLEGGHKQYSSSQQIQAKPNSGILMKCGNFIFEPIADKNSGISKLIVIHFYPDVLNKLYQDDFPKPLLSNDRNLDGNMAFINGVEIVNNYIDSLLLLFDNTKVDKDIIELKLKELIFILAKIDSTKIKQILSNLFNRTTVIFKDVIEAHIYSNLSVEDLASLTNNSLTAFKRKFKELYHASPSNYIKNKRLENAANLLQVTNETITDICFKCAFNDLAYFSNSFKAKFNQTPSEYRSSHADKEAKIESRK